MSTVLSAAKVSSARAGNPYVGPRAFRNGELFFGRTIDTERVLNKLLPGGVMLLYSPSGAGKTSLIQAAVVPEFQKQGFQICAATKPRFSALRVNLPPPKDVDIANRYVFSFVNGLAGHLLKREEAARMTIEQALDFFAQHGPSDNADPATTTSDATRPAPSQLVIIDQLEEVLTIDPSDITGQTEFFRQLGSALRRGRRWALLAIREDFMGGIDQFKRCFQNELRATCRIDFLDEASARQAVQKPAEAHGVTFADDAARQLVADLRRVKATVAADSLPSARRRSSHGAGPTGDVGANSDGPVLYPYVEPVLLQVVCDSLWRIKNKSEPDFTTISLVDLENVKPYNATLSKYCRRVVREASGNNPEAERAIRDWIDRHLLTKEGLRRPTRSLPQVQNQGDVMETLQRRYLIRDDPRPGGSWWELTHDMLVEPIIDDNRAWRLSNLHPWKIAAEEWQRAGRPEGFWLRGATLREARLDAKKSEVTDVEQEFLDVSSRRSKDETRRSRMVSQMTYLGIILTASIVLNIVLALRLWT